MEVISLWKKTKTLFGLSIIQNIITEKLGLKIKLYGLGSRIEDLVSFHLILHIQIRQYNVIQSSKKISVHCVS